MAKRKYTKKIESVVKSLLYDIDGVTAINNFFLSDKNYVNKALGPYDSDDPVYEAAGRGEKPKKTRATTESTPQRVPTGSASGDGNNAKTVHPYQMRTSAPELSPVEFDERSGQGPIQRRGKKDVYDRFAEFEEGLNRRFGNNRVYRGARQAINKLVYGTPEGPGGSGGLLGLARDAGGVNAAVAIAQAGPTAFSKASSNARLGLLAAKTAGKRPTAAMLAKQKQFEEDLQTVARIRQEAEAEGVQLSPAMEQLLRQRELELYRDNPSDSLLQAHFTATNPLGPLAAGSGGVPKVAFDALTALRGVEQMDPLLAAQGAFDVADSPTGQVAQEYAMMRLGQLAQTPMGQRVVNSRLGKFLGRMKNSELGQAIDREYARLGPGTIADAAGFGRSLIQSGAQAFSTPGPILPKIGATLAGADWRLGAKVGAKLISVYGRPALEYIAKFNPALAKTLADPRAQAIMDGLGMKPGQKPKQQEVPLWEQEGAGAGEENLGGEGALKSLSATQLLIAEIDYNLQEAKMLKSLAHSIQKNINYAF